MTDLGVDELAREVERAIAGTVVYAVSVHETNYGPWVQVTRNGRQVKTYVVSSSTPLGFWWARRRANRLIRSLQKVDAS